MWTKVISIIENRVVIICLGWLAKISSKTISPNKLAIYILLSSVTVLPTSQISLHISYICHRSASRFHPPPPCSVISMRRKDSQGNMYHLSTQSSDTRPSATDKPPSAASRFPIASQLQPTASCCAVARW